MSQSFQQEKYDRCQKSVLQRHLCSNKKTNPFLRAAPQISFFPPDFPCSTPIFSRSLSKLMKQLHFYQLLSPPQSRLRFTGGRSDCYIQCHFENFAGARDGGAPPERQLRTAAPAGFRQASILQQVAKQHPSADIAFKRSFSLSKFPAPFNKGAALGFSFLSRWWWPQGSAGRARERAKCSEQRLKRVFF